MTILVSAGFPLLVLLVMFIFGMYTSRNFGWVLLCLLWGVIGFSASFLLNSQLARIGVVSLAIAVIFYPLIQQTFATLGTFFVVHRVKFDNLIDGAVYGSATGLGYSIAENLERLFISHESNLETILLRSFASTLVYVTASGIVGVAVTQFYFRHRANRITILLSGLGAGIGYIAVFNYLVGRQIGGDFLPAAYGIGGLTFTGLYVTGQLRKIIIQMGIEKKRANSLLNIVIPIGVQLSTEKDFGSLLENIVGEAKSFCKADAGTLYLVREKQLEFAVMHNDTLRLAMGGTSPVNITLPGLHLYDENGNPNHDNVATYSALTGETVNIEDAYETKDYDFSGTRAFDRTNSYQSISFLTIPLKGNEGKILGVLQLINALNSKREIIPFDKNLEQLMESYSSLATAALEGYIQEQSLRNEIQELRIQIDQVKRGKQVDEITNSDYFKNLQEKAKVFRNTGPVPKEKPDDQSDAS